MRTTRPTVDSLYTALPAYKRAIWHVIACMIDNARDSDNPDDAMRCLASSTAEHLDSCMHEVGGGCYVPAQQRHLVGLKGIRAAVRDVQALEECERDWLMSCDAEAGRPAPRSHLLDSRSERHCGRVGDCDLRGPEMSLEDFMCEPIHRKCATCEAFRQIEAVHAKYGTRVKYLWHEDGMEMRDGKEIATWHPVLVDGAHVGWWMRQEGTWRPRVGAEMRVSGWENVADAAVAASEMQLQHA